MPNSVTITKNKNNPPSDTDIGTAMTKVGGTVTSIEDRGSEGKYVEFTGTVNHTDFRNTLVAVARGKWNSWDFEWGDDAAVAAAADGYEVSVAMDDDTVDALKDGKFWLYGFKAVKSSAPTGRPLVWFKTGTYSDDTQVSWTVPYEAYTSNSAIIPNGHITAGWQTAIDLGQTLNVDQPGGQGEVVNAGQGNAISIANTTGAQFTCGISAPTSGNGKASPICAFTLYGTGTDVILPIEKVLLMFATSPVNTGVVVEEAFGQGIVIDLTDANSRKVSYDINKGWSWPDNAGWAQTVPANASLLPLLVEGS